MERTIDQAIDEVISGEISIDKFNELIPPDQKPKVLHYAAKELYRLQSIFKQLPDGHHHKKAAKERMPPFIAIIIAMGGSVKETITNNAFLQRYWVTDAAQKIICDDVVIV